MPTLELSRQLEGISQRDTTEQRRALQSLHCAGCSRVALGTPHCPASTGWQQGDRWWQQLCCFTCLLNSGTGERIQKSTFLCWDEKVFPHLLTDF